MEQSLKYQGRHPADCFFMKTCEFQGMLTCGMCLYCSIAIVSCVAIEEASCCDTTPLLALSYCFIRRRGRYVSVVRSYSVLRRRSGDLRYQYLPIAIFDFEHCISSYLVSLVAFNYKATESVLSYCAVY